MLNMLLALFSALTINNPAQSIKPFIVKTFISLVMTINQSHKLEQQGGSIMSIALKRRIIISIYLFGIIADAMWAVALLSPSFYGVLTGRVMTDPSLILRLNMGIGASLMAGWTVLLGWAACDPIERRGVMLITFFPVIVGLVTLTLIGISTGNMNSLWILGKCIILSGAMLTGYWMANAVAKEMKNENNNSNTCSQLSY